MQGKYATSTHCAGITFLVSTALRELSNRYSLGKRDRTSSYELFRAPTGENEWLSISDRIAKQLYDLETGEGTTTD